ncbi:MAG: cytochrome ubiquinol oxidase subunit I [Thermoplasmata archaeon]|nr:hypothetical protein [Euryarchaeota archaeon]MVT35959.1 hypothetical protein [Euryarchaeota archaeon]
MNNVFNAFILLGYATIAHLFLVNLILGISIIIPILEYIQIKRNDDELKRNQISIFKFMVITDLFAGVWATWLTVFLGGFWPLLTFYATTILFIPITISIAGILIALPSIGIYWYTWGKVSNKLHLFIGIIMCIGTIMVPLGFNMIFAFINDPVGINQLGGNLFAVFLNPLYPTFTLHRIFGAITMVSSLLLGIYGYLYYKTNQERYGSMMYILSYIALPSIFIESFLGFIYAFELTKYSPYIASVLFGPFSLNPAENNLYPLFLIFISIILIMWILLISLIFIHFRGKKSHLISISLAIISLIGIPFGEFINDYSRYPYFIITGDKGIYLSQFINNIINITDFWVISSFIVSIAVLSAYLWLLYQVIIKKRFSH